MFDVNARHTMDSLVRWWAEFRDKAPLADEDMEDYCCVVVGNKMDLVGTANRIDSSVTEGEALRFLSELVPPSSPTSPPENEDKVPEEPLASSQLTIRPSTDIESSCFGPRVPSRTTTPPPPLQPQTQTKPSYSNSIAIIPSHATPTSNFIPSSMKHHLLSKTRSRSRSSTCFYAGTMTSTHTSLSIYHTPSSSFFDVFQSARGSPEPWSSSSSVATSPPSGPDPASSVHSHSHSTTTASRSSGSAVTITPSLFARENAGTEITTPEDNSSTQLPHGPKLFFTSAKTGEGVTDVFEYVARRVVRRWEYEELMDAQRMHFREPSACVAADEMAWLSTGKRNLGQCCSS